MMSPETPGDHRCTFAVSEQRGRWQVMRNAVAVGRYHSRGDAVRAACFRARSEERRGGRARVIVGPGDVVTPHYEAYFGL